MKKDDHKTTGMVLLTLILFLGTIFLTGCIDFVDSEKPHSDAGPDKTVDQGALVTFEGSGSSDNVGVDNYTWTFNDGGAQTLYGSEPTYTFNNAGVFVVTLNVTDAAGSWDADTMTVTVNVIAALMAFELSDGVDHQGEYGCFFKIRAIIGVDIDPRDCQFKVAEYGQSARNLEFLQWRYYSDDGMHSPKGGDRNMSYRFDQELPLTNSHTGTDPGNYEAADERWEDGEYIAFDIPKASLGIDIVDGKKYEVIILDPEGDQIFCYFFRYIMQYW